MKKELGIFLLLLLVCIVLSICNPRFLTPFNLRNTGGLVGMYGIISIGMGLVIITRGIDLSVGSVFALEGILLAMMLREWRWPWPLACLAAIGLAMAIGYGHALLITRARLQPFIVTLCGFLIYRGLAMYIAHDESKGFGSRGYGFLRWIANKTLWGIPAPFVVLMIVAVAAGVLLHKTVFGRHLYAVGHNEEAAIYSGINSRRVITLAYVINGLLVGIAAIIFAFQMNTVAPANHGLAFEMYAIAAAVLGGCSLWGGEGSILGIVIGAALLQVLQNLVNLLRIPTSLNLSVMGAVILAGVLADQFFLQRQRRVRAAVASGAETPASAGAPET
jgi:ribose transport system permease protein